MLQHVYSCIFFPGIKKLEINDFHIANVLSSTLDSKLNIVNILTFS